MRPAPARLAPTGLALLTILPALRAQDQRPELTPQFEPSYVVFGPWSPHHPDTTLTRTGTSRPTSWTSRGSGASGCAGWSRPSAARSSGTCRAPTSRHSDLSLFANYFRGQDYYNIYYDQRLSVFRGGFATNRDRARSEIPQQPVF